MKIADLQQLLPSVRQIAQEAGDAILKIYHKGFTVSQKADSTPVTEADIAAHHCIVTGLSELTPGTPVLSEEGDTVSYEERRHWSCYWLVDPLDGTRQFVKRNSEFTVNIALIQNGEVVLGVIWVPVTQVFYYAAKSQGAFKWNIHESKTRRIQTRSFSGRCITVAGKRGYKSEAFQQFLSNLDQPYQMMILGSSLKSCLVAEGEADIYARFGPTGEWDTAAAQCIVEEAGGLVTDLQMQPLRYNTKDSLLNPDFLVFGDRHVDWQTYLPGHLLK